MKEAVAAGDQVLAVRISQFQFRDIRPKAASEITDVDHAGLLLGHTKGTLPSGFIVELEPWRNPLNEESIVSAGKINHSQGCSHGSLFYVPKRKKP